MLNTVRSIPAGLSIATPDGDASYIAVGHYKNNVPVGLLAPLFESLKSCERVWAHNWKHDRLVLSQMGQELPNQADSMILYWLLSLPDLQGRYGLKGLSKRYLGIEPPTFEETVGDHQFFGALDPKSKGALKYACHDARNTLMLAQKADTIPETFGLEMAFCRTLYNMERSGMGIKHDGLEKLYLQTAQAADNIASTWDLLFPGVSITSGKQIRESLFETGVWSERALPRTPGGQVSVNREALDILFARASNGSVAQRAAKLKIDYQDLQKIVSTYTRTLVDQAEQYPDRRLHPSYHQTGTATGRLSCSAPNLQNIPARSEYGRMVKANFVPEPGNKLVTADYSQIELRVLAHYCREGALFDAYTKGIDIHQQTADLVGCTRQQGKTINFASVYGAGPQKLGKLCGVSTKKGAEFLNKYFEVYPELTELREGVVSDAESLGGATTLLGRFRPIPELGSGSHERWRGERLAFNTPIQGGAADIMKLAMVTIDKDLPIDWRLISQVHDELTLEVPEKYVDSAEHFLQTRMEGAFKLDVPLVAEPSSGSTWAECK